METLTIRFDLRLEDAQIEALLPSYIITYEMGRPNSKIKTAEDFEIIDCLIKRVDEQKAEVLVGYNRLSDKNKRQKDHV